MDRLKLITHKTLFNGPCVYAFCIDKNPLYVGYSTVGFTRAYSPTHKKKELRQFPGVQVLGAFCKSIEEAKALEAELIFKYQPPGNKRSGTKGSHSLPVPRPSLGFAEGEWCN